MLFLAHYQADLSGDSLGDVNPELAREQEARAVKVMLREGSLALKPQPSGLPKSARQDNWILGIIVGHHGGWSQKSFGVSQTQNFCPQAAFHPTPPWQD